MPAALGLGLKGQTWIFFEIATDGICLNFDKSAYFWSRRPHRRMSAFGGKADIIIKARHVCFDPKRTPAMVLAIPVERCDPWF